MEYPTTCIAVIWPFLFRVVLLHGWHKDPMEMAPLAYSSFNLYIHNKLSKSKHGHCGFSGRIRQTLTLPCLMGELDTFGVHQGDW